MRPRLKIFTGEDEPQYEEPQVKIPLREFRQIMIDAARLDRTWLRDWDEDTVKVSADLYEILSACSNMRPGA
ncbi:hypothetical protein Pla110_13000 [Polystyrenella longa]|uniref:Uncharacterized protein n=1 Tax=Polystyrenella longa TaxID=2528007 RepID=A0A518CK27_9PLAN|nr:hypothetical protein [Polystyrenella longa]QDU79589.1 hypothetical protein Pla110_13000 [Polystyrenella longa]